MKKSWMIFTSAAGTRMLPLVVSLAIGCASSPGAKPSPQAHGDGALAINGTLLVVHPTFHFDEGEARDEINEIVGQFLDADRPVFTLRDNSSRSLYDKYLTRLQETAIVSSVNGENSIHLISPEVTIVGGYLTACLKIATRHLLRENFKRFSQIRFHLLLRAVYGKAKFQGKGGSIRESVIEHFNSKKFPTAVSIVVHFDGEMIVSKGSGSKVIQLYIDSNGARKRPRLPATI